MIILDKRKYERIVSELIDAKDIREVADRFSMDRVYYYHILKDISSGQRSPNFNLLKNLADRRKLSEDFIIEQSKTVLSYFIPYYEYYQSDSLDCYKILNVPWNASEEDMRRSWIELMKSHHPDKAGAEGLDTSKKINEAYEVLSNSAKREAYDNKSLPAMPVIVPQRDMKKYYYAASVMVVVFFVVMYASGSGLIFKSKEDKERFARELEAPDMPNTVYKGDLLDSEKVDKRVSGIKPLAPAHTAERIIADEGREPEEADRGKAAVPVETAAKNPPVVNSAPADAKTELAEAVPPARGGRGGKDRRDGSGHKDGNCSGA